MPGLRPPGVAGGGPGWSAGPGGGVRACQRPVLVLPGGRGPCWGFDLALVPGSGSGGASAGAGGGGGGGGGGGARGGGPRGAGARAAGGGGGRPPGATNRPG